MKSKFIGKFRLGDAWVRLYACSQLGGGSFSCTPPDKGQPIIQVDIDNPSAEKMTGVLLHEAVEMCLCSHELRYEHSGKWNGDSADYTFIMTHPQFGRVMADVGEFMCHALPAMAKAFSKRHDKR
jgi:hypothetical protein